MKIYQLHEYTGEYEDFRDYIIGSYFSKERADTEMAKAIAENNRLKELSHKCSKCPVWDEDNTDADTVCNYCSDSKLKVTKEGLLCSNYYFQWDDSTFEVKEVDVLE